MYRKSIHEKTTKAQSPPRQADGPLKTLLSRPDVFADAVNYALYKGRKVIRPEDLREKNSEKIYSALSGHILKSVAKFRDVLKEVVIKEDGNTTYLLIGIENQLYADPLMFARAMLYDALDYLAGKGDIPKGTVTIVISYSELPWSAACSLHEYLRRNNVAEDVIRILPDYFYYLMDLGSIEKSERALLQSDLRGVSSFIRLKKDDIILDDYIESREFSDLSDDGKNALWAIKEEKDMDPFHKFKEDTLNQGRVEGRAEGNAEGKRTAFSKSINALMQSQGLTKEQAMDALLIPQSERALYM